MALTHDPRVDRDMEAEEGLHDLPDNPPSKLWVLLGPLGCYIGIIKARQSGTSTTFFRRGMYVTGAMVVLWFLLIAAIVAGINRANDALEALDSEPGAPVAGAPSRPIAQPQPTPEPLVLPAGAARYSVLSLALDLESQNLDEDTWFTQARYSLEIALDRVGIEADVFCGGMFYFVVQEGNEPLDDALAAMSIPLRLESVSATPPSTEGLSASC